MIPRPIPICWTPWLRGGGGGDVADPLASEGAAENPSEQVAPMGNDLFDMAVEQPRNDDVDADHGVTGSSHE